MYVHYCVQEELVDMFTSLDADMKLCSKPAAASDFPVVS